MSTRATIHFKDKGIKEPSAIVYRHCDGYPKGLGVDLKAFFKELKDNVKDTRFGDPAYLAARWIVWDVLRGQKAHVEMMKDLGRPEEVHPLDFLGVGVMMEDPGDIEYRYDVICGGDGLPKVVCHKV